MSTGFKQTPQGDLSASPHRPGNPTCKRCGGSWVVRHGTTRTGTQRLRCKACGVTFLDNAAPPRMRYPAETIAAVLQGFYEGATLKEIADGLEVRGEKAPTLANIHRWIVRFTASAVDAQKDVEALPEPSLAVGDAWVAIESRIESRAFGGQPAWSWDVFDSRTGYLLCSQLFLSRYAGGHNSALGEAERVTGKTPTPTPTKKVDVAQWESASETAQRFERYLHTRGRVLAAAHSARIVRLVMAGWRIDYNLFRPQPELGGLTPAKKAKVNERFGSWAQVVALS